MNYNKRAYYIPSRTKNQTNTKTFDNLENEFSFYADFDNAQDLTSVQEQLEKKIFDQILLDIFNATVANW